MSVHNFVPIHPTDVYIFHCINENFDQLVALVEKSGDHQNHEDSSSRHQEWLYQNSCQSVQYLLRHFSLDQSSGHRAHVMRKANNVSIDRLTCSVTPDRQQPTEAL